MPLIEFILGGLFGWFAEDYYCARSGSHTVSRFKPIYGFGALIFLEFPKRKFDLVYIAGLIFALEWLTGVMCQGTSHGWDYGEHQYVSFKTFPIFLALGFLARNLKDGLNLDIAHFERCNGSYQVGGFYA